MESYKNYIDINQKTWDLRTPIHIKSKFYDNENFIKHQSSLKEIELSAIGEIKNKSLLHLQCHFGQDSISLANMGAKVTAVDFSSVAINEGKLLAKQTLTNVNFINHNVLDLELNTEFDIIFSSYGVLGWLPDLDKWGETISKHLKKGGLFLLTEFHPFIELIKGNGYDYFFNENPDVEESKGSYTDGGENISTKTCLWNHSLTDIFQALENNGLKLTLFEEFDYCPYMLENMIEKEKGKYVLEIRKNLATPYVFNLKATKK